jgi:cob(I)alamin adenosyltransferase
MISITRVYTRTGDLGDTALVGGQRVPKDSPRIAAYGTLDELNAVVGLARTFNGQRLGQGDGARWLDEILRHLGEREYPVGARGARPRAPHA